MRPITSHASYPSVDLSTKAKQNEIERLVFPKSNEAYLKNLVVDILILLRNKNRTRGSLLPRDVWRTNQR